MANRTRFRNTAERCVDLYIDLQGLETGAKLNAEQFLADALAVAGCDEARLDEIEAAIDRTQCLDSLSKFISKTARAVAEPNYVRTFPATKVRKTVYAFGDESTAGEIAGIGATVAEVVAVAVRQAVRRHPERFGSVSVPWAEHEKAVAAARRAFEVACDTLRENYTPNDVEFGQTTDDERGRGLVRLTLKIAPGVSLGAPTWPTDVVRYLLNRRSQPEPVAELGEVSPADIARAVNDVLNGTAAAA